MKNIVIGHDINLTMQCVIRIKLGSIKSDQHFSSNWRT